MSDFGYFIQDQWSDIKNFGSDIGVVDSLKGILTSTTGFLAGFAKLPSALTDNSTLIIIGVVVVAVVAGSFMLPMMMKK